MDLKFLAGGHTQMEVDSIHACIETVSKSVEVFVPRDWTIIAGMNMYFTTYGLCGTCRSYKRYTYYIFNFFKLLLVTFNFDTQLKIGFEV